MIESENLFVAFVFGGGALLRCDGAIGILVNYGGTAFGVKASVKDGVEHFKF